MNFGEIVTDYDGDEWLVVGIADHEFIVRNLEINHMGSTDWFSPSVGRVVVMVWKHDDMPRGFVTQIETCDIVTKEA